MTISSALRAIIRSFTEKKVLRALGESITEDIPKRTRDGKGVRTNGAPTHELPRLKKRTVDIRQDLASRGKLTGPGASPAKSGLNRSGDLLSAVTYEVKGDKTIIKLDKSKERTKTRKLLELNKGFSFMSVSDKELDKAVEAMGDEVTNIIARLNIDKL